MMVKLSLFRRRLTLSLITLLSMTMLILFLFKVSDFVFRNGSQVNADQIRSLKIERLQLARRVAVLNDYSDVIRAVNKGTQSLDSLTLSFIESIEQQAIELGIELIQLSVAPTENDVSSDNLVALKIDFNVKLQHVMHLLPLFDVIKTSADWRPIEIKRCSAIRVSAQEPILQVGCSVDAFYFPGIDS